MNLTLVGALMIQLIFESLPVSSSGHVFLFTSRYPCPLYALYEGVCALPTVGIIIVFFIPSWWPLLRLWSKRVVRYGRLHALSRNLILRLGLYSFISAGLAVIGYLLVKHTFHPQLVASVMPYGFLITMALLFSLRLVPRKKGYTSLRWYHAGIIGFAQAIALVPGISRLAATYVAGRWIGLSTRRSLEYSFLILTPLLGAACLKDCIHLYRLSIPPLEPCHLGALVLGTVIEWFLLKLTYRMAEQDRLSLFGYYMVIPFILAVLRSR